MYALVEVGKYFDEETLEQIIQVDEDENKLSKYAEALNNRFNGRTFKVMKL